MIQASNPVRHSTITPVRARTGVKDRSRRFRRVTQRRWLSRELVFPRKSPYQTRTSRKTPQELSFRADGKRTELVEEFWFDGSAGQPADGIQQPEELQQTTTEWTYDSLGRLVDEAIDHWDDNFDQTESYTYDLTGNRTKVARLSEAVPNATALTDADYDQITSYDYDANDRLLEEVLDDLVDDGNDSTTTYAYDHTQQTEKSVFSGLPGQPQTARSQQLFSYNLQGRMSSAVLDTYDSSGVLQTRQRSSYEYDHGSFRVGQLVENWNETTGTFELESNTEFLVTHQNHTGYAQTLRETTTNADGSSKTIDYTFGHDEISQTAVERDAQGNVTSETTHVFGHDGHGSVCVLYDIAATADSLIEAVATYSSYGVLLATHASDGTLSPVAFDLLTSLTYSGEAWDSVLNRGYNRARWYDASSAQWNRLDPFAGNMQDPQSLHKYAYVHGDPVNGVDPTGEFLIASISAIAIGLANDSRSAAASYTAKQSAQLVLSTATGASVAAIAYHLLGRSAVRGSGFGAQHGAGLFIAHRRDGFSVVNRTLGRGKHYYLKTAVQKGASAALATTVQAVIGQGRNFINNPNAQFNGSGAFSSVATSAFESFSQGVFAEATSSQFNLPATVGPIDAFISSIAVDLTDALITGEKVDWSTVIERSTQRAVVQGVSAMATEMDLPPGQHAAFTTALTTWLNNFFDYASEFEVIDKLFSALDCAGSAGIGNLPTVRNVI